MGMNWNPYTILSHILIRLNIISVFQTGLGERPFLIMHACSEAIFSATKLCHQ